MPAFKDLTGQKFNLLTVISHDCVDSKHNHLWSCKCDCGKNTIVSSRMLKSGGIKSCGCLRVISLRKKLTTHGATGHPLFGIWSGMIHRCYNPSAHEFKYYGERGIIVCEKWRNNPHSFFSDMGERPSSKHTLDRINNDGNYTPDNCKWSTPKEQANNRQSSHYISFNGETHTIAQWCDILNMKWHTFDGRMRRNWSIEKTITTPVEKCKTRKHAF